MTENLEQVLDALRQIDKDVLDQAEAAYRQEASRQAQDVALLRLKLRALKEATQKTAPSMTTNKGKRKQPRKPALQTVAEEEEGDRVDLTATTDGDAVEKAEATKETEPVAKGRGNKKGSKAKEAAPAAEAAAAPVAPATRSRRAAMQEEMANFVFPSPPKARAPRKKRAAKLPVAAPAPEEEQQLPQDDAGSSLPCSQAADAPPAEQLLESTEPHSEAKGAADGQASATAVADAPTQTSLQQASEAEGDSPAEAAFEEGEDTATDEGPSADGSQLTSASSGTSQTAGQQLKTAGTGRVNGGGASLLAKAVSRLASTTRSAALQQSAASSMSAQQLPASPAQSAAPEILDARPDGSTAIAPMTSAAALSADSAKGRQASEALLDATPAAAQEAACVQPSPATSPAGASSTLGLGHADTAPASPQPPTAEEHVPPRGAPELALSPQPVLLHTSSAAAAAGGEPLTSAEQPAPDPIATASEVSEAARESDAAASKEHVEQTGAEKAGTASKEIVAPAVELTARVEEQADDTPQMYSGRGDASRTQEVASGGAVHIGGTLPSAMQQELERAILAERISLSQEQRERLSRQLKGAVEQAVEGVQEASSVAESLYLTAVASQTPATQAQGTGQPQQTQAAEPQSQSMADALAAETAPMPAEQDVAAPVSEGQAALDEELVNKRLPEIRSAMAEQACEAAQAAGGEPGTSQAAAAAEQPQPGKAEAGQKPSGLVQQASSNLLHGFRSLIPVKTAPAPLLGGGKKAPEVDALKAAEALRRREAAREAERQDQKRKLKADRARHAQQVKAKQEETRRREAEEAKQRGDAMKKKEEEAASRRRAKEEADRKEREDKQRRLEEARSKKRQEEATRQDTEAKRQKLPQAVAKADAGPQAPLKASAPAVQHAAGPSKLSQHEEATGPSSVVAHALQQARQQVRPSPSPAPAAAQSIEIAPYRGSDEESEEERDDVQLRPQWATEPYLSQQLLAQRALDPDEIFQQHANTCSLDEVFSSMGTAGDPRRDLTRRTSSGNWLKDRVTWREEINYKRAMGYLPQAGQDADD